VTQPPHLGGLGFHLKWNMGWMNDFLRFMHEEPVHRKYHFNLLTFSLMYAFSEKFVLPFSHDEVVHGKGSLPNKMPGDDWQKFANLRLALAFMWAHPGKKLLFMGIEFGQWREWSEERSLDWHLLDEGPLHSGMQRFVQSLNVLYHSLPPLWKCDFTHEGFEWVDFHDVEQSVLTFVRRGGPGDEVLFAFNFTPVPRHQYRVGVPHAGFYRELLNSDAEIFGGSNVGNGGGVGSVPEPAQGRDHSICVSLPPLGVLVMRREAEGHA
jgi:1,4-alpha-glucan branching enzyme